MKTWPACPAKKHASKSHCQKLPHAPEAEEAVNSIAFRANEKRKKVAEMDAKILAIKSEYETSIAELDKAIAANADALQTWAENNPDEFPKGRKSIEFLSGVLGFRTGTATSSHC